MAGVDKFGAAFAVAFMVAMIAFMGSLSPDGELPGISMPETTTPATTPTPPAQISPPETVTTPSTTDNLTGFLKYTIRGGIVDSITNNPDENSVTVMMDNRLDGQLTITMSKDAITAFDDGSYFVTIDGEENHDFVQIGQRLTIDFLAGSEEIMIFGEDTSHDDHDMSSMDHSEDLKEHEAMMAAEAAAAEAAAVRDPAVDLVDTLSHSASSGSVSSIMTNSDDATLVVAIDTSDDGELSINLDSDYITAFDDGTSFVLVNGEEAEFSQDGNDLTIPFEAGTEKIEIVGSVVVPEFGTIAMIVLAVAIVSIIAITAKTRTALIPKI